MDAIELLTTRQSQPRLKEPAPAGEALENIKKAALRAPDHASLKPWKFIICEGNGRKKLGDLLEQAAIASDMSERDIERAPELPLRAPMVIIAIMQFKEHPKVPWVEQVAATASAINSMQMAAVAQGFQGIWRTGAYAQDENLKSALFLEEQDEIVGFLYLGTPGADNIEKDNEVGEEFFEHWC
ncbi:NAD(P)H nitroreductase [Planctobacterium marinum]|uniref:NAD(P)H nitroreductase n=1 Tax=Planctobacterium marinum TaxID=1631968 RepID=UPI001E52BC6C|nr:NAD(P)H nitroreductase [Planctobacterium marinum]MCC2607299.1 NAD(P)H nitroreductase [Planctobacterium marinum]